MDREPRGSKVIMEEDIPPRSTPRMKNPNTSFPYSLSSFDKEEDYYDDEEENSKDVSEKESGSKDKNYNDDGSTLKNKAIRRVVVLFEKYHHQKYHPLYFPLRLLRCPSLKNRDTLKCRPYMNNIVL